MADSAIGIDRTTDAASYSPFPSGDRSGADRGGCTTNQAADPFASQKELAGLIQLGTEKVDAGADAEATECFQKALEIGEHVLSPDNPDLVLLLNDLTRLYLKQSRYAEAEPLLLRLFEMKRSKGDDHPEVATVLASIAADRQALGQHESAEQLWRRVLEIRERTLAPNHFAIATALEGLGEACAARGNNAEALPALQRALTIRERTLGAGHPSLRRSKERIADLQLQSAEDSLDSAPGMDIVPSKEKYRLLSGEHLRLTAPAPVPPVAIVRDVATAPPPAVGRDLTTQIASRQTKVILQLPPSESMMPDVVPGREQTLEAQAVTADLPYRDALESIRTELEGSQETVPLAVRLSAMVQRTTAFLTRREVVAVIIVAVVSVFSVAVAKTNPSGDLEANATNTSASQLSSPTAQTAPVVTAAALSTPVHESSASAENVSSAKPSAKAHAEEHSSSKKSEDSRAETRKLTLPTLSTAVMSNLDSVASRAAESSANRAEPVITVPTATFGARRGSFDLSYRSTDPIRARLIGELPTPQVPERMSDVEGEVRVRFSVDTQGQPVMSTFAVVRSPNPLLTAAVRRVIPSMHFVPASTGGSDPKPIADVVETSFRFARQNR
jgi:hypothetical protein